MFSNEDIQRAYRVCLWLHRNPEIAYEVTLDGIRRGLRKLADQHRRPPSSRPNKQKLSVQNALFSGIFAASEAWEKDQESRIPLLRPLYTPNEGDLLSRYIKTLVWQSMDRNSAWVSIAIGHFVFGLSLDEIARLSPEFFDNYNMSRIRSYLGMVLQARFHWEGSNLARGQFVPVVERPASDEEFRHIEDLLIIFAPQSESHPDSCDKSGGLLESYLFPNSARSESERIHSLICTECCGWARFVDEFNEDYLPGSAERLASPRNQLRIPRFVNGSFSAGTSNTIDEDARTLSQALARESLSAIELRSLRRSTAARGRLIQVDDGIA